MRELLRLPLAVLVVESMVLAVVVAADIGVRVAGRGVELVRSACGGVVALLLQQPVVRFDL
jgi:hypothetical protein